MSGRRRVPGWERRCDKCGQAVVFAITAASPTGAGGKWQPFDPFEDPDGNVGVRAIATNGRGVARALGKDDTLDRETEVLAMPHAATCQPKIAGTDPLPAGVVDLASARAARRRR